MTWEKERREFYALILRDFHVNLTKDGQLISIVYVRR